MEFIDHMLQLVEMFLSDSHKLIGFLMMAVLLLSVVGIFSFGSIFIFHWRKYGNGGKTLKNAEWIFIFGSLAILFLMVLSFLSFWF
jgi:hypothetical protein